MKKTIIILLLSFWAFWIYWGFVISISTNQQKTGNEFGWQALLYGARGQEKEHDSCWGLFKHYSEMSDNTKKLVPKFTRP